MEHIFKVPRPGQSGMGENLDKLRGGILAACNGDEYEYVMGNDGILRYQKRRAGQSFEYVGNRKTQKTSLKTKMLVFMLMLVPIIVVATLSWLAFKGIVPADRIPESIRNMLISVGYMIQIIIDYLNSYLNSLLAKVQST